MQIGSKSTTNLLHRRKQSAPNHTSIFFHGYSYGIDPGTFGQQQLLKDIRLSQANFTDIANKEIKVEDLNILKLNLKNQKKDSSIKLREDVTDSILADQLNNQINISTVNSGAVQKWSRSSQQTLNDPLKQSKTRYKRSIKLQNVNSEFKNLLQKSESQRDSMMQDDYLETQQLKSPSNYQIDDSNNPLQKQDSKDPFNIRSSTTVLRKTQLKTFIRYDKGNKQRLVIQKNTSKYSKIPSMENTEADMSNILKTHDSQSQRLNFQFSSNSRGAKSQLDQKDNSGREANLSQSSKKNQLIQDIKQDLLEIQNLKKMRQKQQSLQVNATDADGKKKTDKNNSLNEFLKFQSPIQIKKSKQSSLNKKKSTSGQRMVKAIQQQNHNFKQYLNVDRAIKQSVNFSTNQGKFRPLPSEARRKSSKSIKKIKEQEQMDIIDQFNKNSQEINDLIQQNQLISNVNSNRSLSPKETHGKTQINQNINDSSNSNQIESLKTFVDSNFNKLNRSQTNQNPNANIRFADEQTDDHVDDVNMVSMFKQSDNIPESANFNQFIDVPINQQTMHLQPQLDNPNIQNELLIHLNQQVQYQKPPSITPNLQSYNQANKLIKNKSNQLLNERLYQAKKQISPEQKYRHYSAKQPRFIAQSMIQKLKQVDKNPRFFAQYRGQQQANHQNTLKYQNIKVIDQDFLHSTHFASPKTQLNLPYQFLDKDKSDNKDLNHENLEIPPLNLDQLNSDHQTKEMDLKKLIMKQDSNKEVILKQPQLHQRARSEYRNRRNMRRSLSNIRSEFNSHQQLLREQRASSSQKLNQVLNVSKSYAESALSIHNNAKKQRLIARNTSQYMMNEQTEVPSQQQQIDQMLTSYHQYTDKLNFPRTPHSFSSNKLVDDDDQIVNNQLKFHKDFIQQKHVRPLSVYINYKSQRNFAEQIQNQSRQYQVNVSNDLIEQINHQQICNNNKKNQNKGANLESNPASISKQSKPIIIDHDTVDQSSTDIIQYNQIKNKLKKQKLNNIKQQSNQRVIQGLQLGNENREKNKFRACQIKQILTVINKMFWEATI